MTRKQAIGRWVYSHLPCSRRTFETVRREFRFFRQRCGNALIPWRRSRLSRLRDLRDVSLNVGSGGRGLDGWINFDASPYHADLYSTFDIRKPLPFSDGAVRRIFAEHVIEHLDYHDDIPRVFREFHRVLAPGGTVRIIVPDAERYLRAYAGGEPGAWRALGVDPGNLPGGMLTPMEVVNHIYHQEGEHFFGWDFATMEARLRLAGFPVVLQSSYARSSDSELALDQPNHAPYSLYVEAVK